VAALLTWLPPLLVQTLISLGSLAALRYVVGSWRAVGWTLWWPITTISLISGNIDLLIAAAMVMAWRGRPGWLALFGLAKVAPFLGLPLGSWRRCAVIVGAAVLATAPWWHLWPEWLAYLIGQPGVPTYALLVPWWLRLPVALALVALRRPWASAAAVVVAMPYLYGFTTMEGLAVIRLWADGRRRA
jgi:hypothetical protein